jgi:hypothetical protein
MFILTPLENFTHKILFQGPMSYTCLFTLKNKIISNQFELISVNFKGFCLLKRCSHEIDGIMTHHIKEANIKTLLSTSLEFQRDGILLNAVFPMQYLQFQWNAISPNVSK